MIQQLYNEEALPIEDLQKINLAENDKLKLDPDDLALLLAGRCTNMLRLENLVHDGIHIRQLDAKLSLWPNREGGLDLLLHPIYLKAKTLPYLTDTEMEKLQNAEVPNIEKKIIDDDGNAKEVLIEFDSQTNEFIAIDQARILVPDRVNGQYLSLDQKERYRKGKEVDLPDGTTLQFSATAKEGIRSNKLALVASVLIDGGLSFALYHGLHYLFGQKKHDKDASVYSKGYHDDLEKFEEQQRRSETAARQPRNQESRAYSRTGSR